MPNATPPLTMKLNEPEVTLQDIVRSAAQAAAFEASIVDQLRTILREQLDAVNSLPTAGPWTGPAIAQKPLPPPAVGTMTFYRGLPIVSAKAGNGVFTLQFIMYAKPDAD